MYVASQGNDTVPGTVSVIATASNAVIAQITVGLQPIAFGIFITPEVQSAPASGTSCNGVFNGTFMGDITVSAGQDCTFIDGGQVIGNVNVLPGGHFSGTGTKITKNVTISGPLTTWSMVRNTVGGNAQVQNIPDPPASPTNFMCGTTVNGDLQFQNNGTAVQIGSADPLICAGNTIGGNLQVNNNTSTVLIFDNVVGNDLQVGNNTGALDVVGNNVGGNLQCQGNSMLIMGGMNTAKQTEGQCN